jgi:hypothetical protein
MGCDRPSAHGGRGAGNHPAYCIGQASQRGSDVDRHQGGVAALENTGSTWRRPASMQAAGDSGRNRSNPAGSQGPRRPDFAIPKTVSPAHGLTSHRYRSRCCSNSLKSAINAPARFHRFQEIQSGSSTPSTADLYDLYTRCGRTVDKKGTFPRL